MKTIILTLFVIFLASCSKYDQNVIIDNVSESQAIKLTNNKKGNVHSINIRFSGHIQGNAQVQLMLNGNPYKTENIKGKVHLKWGGDWYSDNAIIKYTATNVTNGKILIEYKFETI